MYTQYYDSVLFKSSTKISWVLASSKTKRTSQVDTVKALAFDLFNQQIKSMSDALNPCCQRFLFERDGHYCPYCGLKIEKFSFLSFLGFIEQLHETRVWDSNSALSEFSFTDSKALENSLGTVVFLPEQSEAVLCHALLEVRPDLLSVDQIPAGVLSKRYLWDQIRFVDLTNETSV